MQKNPNNKEEMKIVKIEWIDPQFLEMTGLSYSDDLDEIRPQSCCIVGHLVKETKDVYFVAKELWDNKAFKYVHIIPKRIVEKMEVLKCSKRPK